MYKLKVVVRENKNHKKYSALVLDLGYCKKYLSFDVSLCSELVGVTPHELFEVCTTSEYILVEFSEFNNI